MARSLQQSAALATAIGGPIAGGIVEAAAGIAQIVSLFGPNPNNAYATEVVNQVEADGLVPNVTAWQALATDDKTLKNQAAAEAVFMAGWNYVLTACNNPALGSAGINCIKDRQRGGKFDWWKAYYDLIANDPAPAANAALAAAAVTTTAADGTTTTASDGTSTIPSIISGVSNSNLYLYGGLGLLTVALVIGVMD